MSEVFDVIVPVDK